MQPAVFVILGGLLAALAVGLGAIGAHALKSQLTAQGPVRNLVSDSRSG